MKHVAQYSPLLSDSVKRSIAQAPPQPPIKERFAREHLPLSELPLFLNKTYSLNVPVYTVWGACEDVQVLEKLRSGEYKVDNLHIIDEAHSRLLDVGGVKLRLLGLGGAVVMHKLFDNGEGRTTIAGGQGTMWTTLLQMGELVDTANRVYDPTETRIFVTHASPAREGLLNQLSVTLKADFSISAGLHFRYGSSYNEFSVNPTLDHYRGKLAASKASFNDVWDTVKTEVEPAVADSESQQRLLALALDIVNKMPTVANGGNPFGGPAPGPQSGVIDESAFKNMWNFNLADAAYGWLVLDIDNGRIGTEMRAQGFNFAHRGGKAVPGQTPQSAAAATTSAAPPTAPSPAAPSPAQGRPGGPPANAPQQPRPAVATPPVPQQQQIKPAQPSRSGPSPGPAASTKEPAKAATPQPTASNNAVAEKATSSEVKPNGTSAPEKGPASPAPREPVERKESKGLFISGVKDEEEAKALLAEEDRSKIEKLEKIKHFFVAHFATTTDMQGALRRVADDVRNARGGDKPSVKIYNERPSNAPRYGAGNWQASNRGGVQSGSGGYRSGGASDSEGGRGGRGGRGGAPRGARGGERGGRGGRGRGFRGGAGEGAAASTGGES